MKIEILKSNLSNLSEHVSLCKLGEAEHLFVSGFGLIKNQSQSPRKFVAAGRYLVRELATKLSQHGVRFSVSNMMKEAA